MNRFESIRYVGSSRRRGRPTMHDTNGESATKEGRTWSRMWNRCTDPKNKSWKYYGGRPENPITVCNRWRSFQNFKRDMGLCPGTGGAWQIHRVDRDGPYSPKNCIWISDSDHSKLHSKAKHIAAVELRQRFPDENVRRFWESRRAS